MDKVRLGDVFTIIRNGANIKQEKEASGIPITRIETISDRIIDRNRLGYANIFNKEKYSDYILQDSDILMSHINSEKHLGKVAIYKKKDDNEIIIHGMNLLMLRADKTLLYSPYAMYYFNTSSFLRQIVSITKKSVNQASFTVTALKELYIPLPTLNRQQFISNTLDKLTDLIEKRKKQLEKLDELIKSRFVEMFGDVNNNKFAYPVVRLGDYARLQGGYAFKSNDFVEEGIPLVQIGNVNKDYLNWDVINSVPYTYLKRFGDFSLKEGDLVMAMTRPIIKTLDSVKLAKVGKSDLPCLLNQRVGRFILSDRLNEIFLEFLCKTDNFKDYVEKMSGNSLQPNISSKQVEDYIIILPPKKLQESFSAFVAQIDKSKSAVQNGLEKLELLKNALMQEYFG